MLHPLRSGSSLITAAVYLPACSHGSVRSKHGRSSPSSSERFRSASPALILAAAAASDCVLVTQTWSRGGCAHDHPSRNKITSATPGTFAQLTARSAAAVLGNRNVWPPLLASSAVASRDQVFAAGS